MASPTPLPPGAKIWTRPVPPALTAWASAIVHDPATYPMGSTTTEVFGGVTALARVEWHTWTNRGGKRVNVDPPIRGVTVYDLSPAVATCNASTMSLAPMACAVPVNPEGDVYPWDAEVSTAAMSSGANLGRLFAFGVGGMAAYLLTDWLWKQVRA